MKIITDPINEPVSPTVMERWLKCPTYGWLAQRYEPTDKVIAPYKVLGIAIAKGFEAWLESKRVGTEVQFSNDPNELVTGAIELSWPPDDLNWPIETLVATALKGYDKGIKNLTSCLETEKVIAVEEPLDKWNARADLITERGSDFIVTDHKVRYKYDARYAPSNQLESEVSWQLWDYAYRVSLKYDRPVTHIRTHFVYLTPSPKSVLHEKAITEQAIENWHLGAEVKWAEWHKLHRGLLIEQPMITINCHNRYGKCEFYDFCWLAEKDEQRAAMLYNKKGGKSGMDSQNNQMP